MKKENLENIWEEFCVAAKEELKSKKKPGNVIELFTEVKWNENGIEELSILNSCGLQNILNGEAAEYEKDELDIFNKDGKIDRNIRRPMRLDLNSYVTSVPALVLRYSDDKCDITYPNMSTSFNN